MKYFKYFICVVFVSLYSNCKDVVSANDMWKIKECSVVAKYPYSKVVKYVGYKVQKICMMQSYANFFDGKIVSVVATGTLKYNKNAFYPTYDEKISLLDASLNKINKKYKINNLRRLTINLELWQELYNVFIDYYDSNNFKQKFKSTKFYKDISIILNNNGYKIECFAFDCIYIQESTAYFKKEYNRDKIITRCCTFDIIKKR